jgi:hypothetical protein
MFLREGDSRAPAVAVLADNLSGLLRQAVEDAQVVAKMTGYALNMSRWHWTPKTQQAADEVCYICMAGAVMVRRLNVPRSTPIGSACQLWEAFDEGVVHKMLAIDHMRRGDFVRAFESLYGLPPQQALRDGLLQRAQRALLDDWDEERATWPAYLAAATSLEHMGL